MEKKPGRRHWVKGLIQATVSPMRLRIRRTTAKLIKAIPTEERSSIAGKPFLNIKGTNSSITW